MKKDKYKHRRHAGDVTMETVDATHPVLEDHTVQVCPRDGCRWHELPDDVESLLDHDVQAPDGLEAHLDDLLDQVDLPVFQVEHVSGMADRKKAFPTYAEAEAWVFGNYGGPGDGNAGAGYIRSVRTYASGTHSQRAVKRDYPMVFAIVHPRLNPSDYGRVPYTNLVPRPDDYPDSATWKSNPSVLDAVDYHLDPPGHVIRSKYGDTSRTPDFFDGDALAYHVQQVTHWRAVIQTPELFLSGDEQRIADQHATDWTPGDGGGDAHA